MNQARLLVAEAMISVAYFQCWFTARVILPRSQQPVSTYIEGRTRIGRRNMVSAIRASRKND